VLVGAGILALCECPEFGFSPGGIRIASKWIPGSRDGLIAISCQDLARPD